MNLERKSCGFKNIRIRVDGALELGMQPFNMADDVMMMMMMMIITTTATRMSKIMTKS